VKYASSSSKKINRDDLFFILSWFVNNIESRTTTIFGARPRRSERQNNNNNGNHDHTLRGKAMIMAAGTNLSMPAATAQQPVLFHRLLLL